MVVCDQEVPVRSASRRNFAGLKVGWIIAKRSRSGAPIGARLGARAVRRAGFTRAHRAAEAYQCILNPRIVAIVVFNERVSIDIVVGVGGGRIGVAVGIAGVAFRARTKVLIRRRDCKSE